jgi:Ca2+-binding RTX toxin-like protein
MAPLGISRSGGAQDVLIEGTALSDLLVAGAVSTEIRGGAGDDILVAHGQAVGTLRMWGGAGADIFLPVYNGRNQILMDFEPGVDSLDLSLFPMLRSVQQLLIQTTATGAVLQFGDTVITIVSASGGPLAVSYFTDDALLTLTRYAPFQEPELLTGTNDADRIALGPNGGEAYGLAGDDTIWGGTGNALIGGGAGNDLIHGISGQNRIWGGLGRDTVQGGDGADEITETGTDANQLFGNDGNDTIWGGDGFEFISGGAGRDALLGGGGGDTLYGGLGDDFIGGGSGNDLIIDGAGNNQIWGGAGNDTLQGGSGNEELYGGDGGDEIYLGLGTDTVGGGAGNDFIQAAGGNSLIWAGYGSDIIRAGTGRDVINGGPGADVFVFASAAQAGIRAGRDVITDFTAGVDYIDLRGLGLHFNAGAWFSGSGGQVIVVNGLVIGDVNGDAVADFVIELTGAPNVTATDFLF